MGVALLGDYVERLITAMVMETNGVSSYISVEHPENLIVLPTRYVTRYYEATRHWRFIYLNRITRHFIFKQFT